MTKQNNKKQNIVQESRINENNDAVQKIKTAIQNSRDSYKDFLAGGIFILLHDAGGRDSLTRIVKTEYTDSDWKIVERGYRRKIHACEVVIKYKKKAVYKKKTLEKMTVDEIRGFIDSLKLTAAIIDSYEKSEKKKSTTTANPVKTAGLPIVPNKDFMQGVKSTDEDGVDLPEVNEDGESPVLKIFNLLNGLDETQKVQLAKYAESKGYFFEFHKKTTASQYVNLYGSKKAVNN